MPANVPRCSKSHLGTAGALSVAVGGGLATACYYIRNTPCLASATFETSAAGFVAEPVTNLATLLQHPDDTACKMELCAMNTQADIVRTLDDLERGKICEVDRWTDDDGVSGVTCVIQDGDVFEAATVSVTVSSRELADDGTPEYQQGSGPLTLFSVGLTAAIHPRNPNVPTLQFSYEYMEVRRDSKPVHWWFEGWTDITPYILHEDDVRFFHGTLKETCDAHDPTYYLEFKRRCDDRFYIKHRRQHRGLGGICFEGFRGPSQEDAFSFVSDCIRAVLPSYEPIVRKNLDMGYSYSDRDWQLRKRGRLVEYNLLCERQSLATGDSLGNALLSLPPNARWWPGPQPTLSPNEKRLLDCLRTPRVWV